MRLVFQDASVQELLQKYSKEPANALKIATQLSTKWNQQERLWISEWISLAPKIAEKFQISEPLLCDRLALEQSTGKDIGTWKTQLWPKGSKLLDLCCGMGGDSFFLSSDIQIEGVDLDPLRCAMFETNTAVFGKARKAKLGNALDPAWSGDFFQIDPARRSTLGGNQRRIADLTPNLTEILHILPRFQGALLKLPPGFPTEDLPEDSNRSYLGSRNDCRECLVSLGNLSPERGMIQAVCLPEGLLVSAHRESVEAIRLEVSPLGAYLVEPNPVLVRSHLFPILAQPLGMWQIDSQIAYLSCDASPEPSPWWSVFPVVDYCSLSTSKIRQMLKKHGIEPMTLKKRGVEVEPAEELRRLKAEKGVPGVLFYTRIRNEKVAILTLAQGKG